LFDGTLALSLAGSVRLDDDLDSFALVRDVKSPLEFGERETMCD
jgi:hypothetical protein